MRKSRAVEQLSSLKNSISTRSESAQSLDAERPPGFSRQSSSWAQWAGQKIKQVAQAVTSDGERRGGPAVENIYVFPGWASRRYHDMDNSALRDAPFDVQVAVSGWCSSHNAPGALSRSQRAFIRVAKGYASLPRLPEALASASSSMDEDRSPMSQSTEDLIRQLHLPPPPSEMNSEEAEMAALEQHLRRANLSEADLLSASPPPLSRASSATSAVSGSGGMTASPAASSASLSQMHANLESRLLPFWSSVLPARTVRLSLFVSPNPDAKPFKTAGPLSPGSDASPIAVQHVQTAQDGSFAFSFGVPWERLCTHPSGLSIAFGDPMHEHTLIVQAELLASPPAPPPQSHRQSLPPASLSARASPERVAHVSTQVSLSHSPVRLVSDIDDTVKYSNILSGARSVFFNVFVRELNEALIPGMPEWYNEMWQRGVRFHYVSNGPFEILPVVTDFFRISKLPPGSVKLRSYAGRALFNGIFAAPAARKRAGVLDVLDSFPFSRFLLVGDSGEQDLELYAQLAFERPRQVLAVFVRDVGADGPTPPLDDPTGALALTPDSPVDALQSTPLAAGGGGILAASLRRSDTVASGSSDLAPPQPPYAEPAAGAEAVTPRRSSLSSDAATPRAVPYAPYKSKASRAGSVSSLRSTLSSGSGYFAPARSPNTQTSFPGAVAEQPEHEFPPTPSVADAERGREKRGKEPQLSEPERRQQELQARVYRARALIPPTIPLRVFRDRHECVEATEILDRLHVGNSR